MVSSWIVHEVILPGVCDVGGGVSPPPPPTPTAVEINPSPGSLNTERYLEETTVNFLYSSETAQLLGGYKY